MVSGLGCLPGQHEFPITVRALDGVIAAHLKEHLWVAQGATTPVTGDAMAVNGDHFCGRGRHGAFARILGFGRIILTRGFTASAGNAPIALDRRFR
jgi:hypothetical protein